MLVTRGRKDRIAWAANGLVMLASSSRLTCACLVAALAIAVAACSEQERTVPATPELLKQMGLPLYPHATPMRRGAHQMTMSSRLGATISMIVQYESTDDFEKIRQFYEERLPSTKRVIAIPIGQVHNITWQFADKTGQKQVSLVSIRGITLIQLQSTTLSFAQPSSSPSAAASPPAAPASSSGP
jgi:hypothetical protein